ncbi:MAG: hypothetical protein KKF48_03005 [Nanoarchaeota archaeon]|nr:hypothetical protein [Nanoarchaeota archaeon]MBU1027992.1 hypothetical protein [Nanoarchaeota archaeon]
MVLRKAKEILPTIKVKPTSDEDLEYVKEMDVSIQKIKDLETKHGDRLVATVDSGQLKFDVFLNNFSISNLIGKYGEDDVNWIGQKVKITKDKSPKFGKEMIVLKPL